MTHNLDIIKELLNNMPNEEFLELHNSMEKNIGPTTENYYLMYRGKCREYSEQLCTEDDELRLVRGYYHCPMWGKQDHWWCEYPDGRVVDPTVKQFPTWKMASENPELFYEEFDGMCECAECGTKIKEEDARIEGRYTFCSTVCNMRFVGL